MWVKYRVRTSDFVRTGPSPWHLVAAGIRRPWSPQVPAAVLLYCRLVVRLTAGVLERVLLRIDASPVTRWLTLPGKIMDLSCSNYSGSRYRRREGKKRNSIKSSKLIGLLARLA